MIKYSSSLFTNILFIFTCTCCFYYRGRCCMCRICCDCCCFHCCLCIHAIYKTRIFVVLQFVEIVFFPWLKFCNLLPHFSGQNPRILLYFEVSQDIPVSTGHFCPHCLTSFMLAVIVSGISPCSEVSSERVLLTAVSLESSENSVM